MINGKPTGEGESQVAALVFLGGLMPVDTVPASRHPLMPDGTSSERHNAVAGGAHYAGASLVPRKWPEIEPLDLSHKI